MSNEPVMRRGFTRRRFLGAVAKAGAIGAAAGSLPVKVSLPAAASATLTPAQRATLDAALARLIPADGPGDWSAADVGAGEYIQRLLSGDGRIYAGGPNRSDFPEFRPMSRAKEMGWAEEVARLRTVYAEGLAELDRRAGGNFAAVPPEVQDEVLTTMDLEGSDFFRALYAHTMEGVYSHPVYGGNRGYQAWRDLCYQGDVHGVRFPGGDPQAPWNVHGGYSPDEMAQPGACPEVEPQ